MRTRCIVLDCSSPAGVPGAAKGMCRSHYHRLRIHGDPLAGKPVGLSPDERFDAKVDASGGPDTCWPWMGSTNADGYGTFNVGGRVMGSHRYALERALGRPLAPGMVTRHACDNPPCCNPDHLSEGTVAQNSADMVERGRHPLLQRDECPEGHPFAGENLYIYPGGARGCRQCQREHRRRYAAAARGEQVAA